MLRCKHLWIIPILFMFSITNYIHFAMAAPIPSPPRGLSISTKPGDQISPPTPSPSLPGNEGLLSGMTPSKYSLPSGWSLIRAQDFESGSANSDEWVSGGKVTDAGYKRGNYALRGLIYTDGAGVSWGLEGDTPTGTYTELYMSFYEFTDSNARFNVEYIWGSNTKNVDGSVYHRVNFNYFDTMKFNGTAAPYVVQGEGAAMDAYAWYGPYRTIPVGRWVQREVWHRPNTPGNRDGFIRFYEDGVLVQNEENVSTNGPADFRSGTWIQVGGLYTKHVWRLSDGSCSSAVGEGTGYDRETNWDACACPNQCPPSGTVPKFYRQLDDIIVMKR